MSGCECAGRSPIGFRIIPTKERCLFLASRLVFSDLLTHIHKRDLPGSALANICHCGSLFALELQTVRAQLGWGCSVEDCRCPQEAEFALCFERFFCETRRIDVVPTIHCQEAEIILDLRRVPAFA